MRALTKQMRKRAPSDLYRTPVELLDAWLEDIPELGYQGYRPRGFRQGVVSGNDLLVCDPTAGDGRWGLRLSSILGCECVLSDIHPYGYETIQRGDALEWKRPDDKRRVIAASNFPFRLLDPIVQRVWGELRNEDELVFLITSVSHANMSRPVLYRILGIMPYHDVYSIRWRCPMESAEGKSLGGAAVDYQIVRAVKGRPVRLGETRLWDVYSRKQQADLVPPPF